MTYTALKIAQELQATAQGDAYFGNALYVARDLPCVTKNDIQCLNRWLNGTQTSVDRFRLQDMVVYITEWANKADPITEYYKDRQNSGQATLTAHKP